MALSSGISLPAGTPRPGSCAPYEVFVRLGYKRADLLFENVVRHNFEAVEHRLFDVGLIGDALIGGVKFGYLGDGFGAAAVFCPLREKQPNCAGSRRCAYDNPPPSPYRSPNGLNISYPSRALGPIRLKSSPHSQTRKSAYGGAGASRGGISIALPMKYAR